MSGNVTGLTKGEFDEWFENKFPAKNFFGRLSRRYIGGALRDPRIFAVLAPRPAYHQAAFAAWRGAMWHSGGLRRRTREAIAVAVSIANHCVY